MFGKTWRTSERKHDVAVERSVNADFPSHLLLPITSGNIVGTYISGGEPYL